MEDASQFDSERMKASKYRFMDYDTKRSNYSNIPSIQKFKNIQQVIEYARYEHQIHKELAIQKSKKELITHPASFPVFFKNRSRQNRSRQNISPFDSQSFSQMANEDESTMIFTPTGLMKYPTADSITYINNTQARRSLQEKPQSATIDNDSRNLTFGGHSLMSNSQDRPKSTIDTKSYSIAGNIMIDD